MEENKPENPQAFPRQYVEGMTLRDYFAAQVIPILLKNAFDLELTFDGYESFDGMIAEQAYELSDKILKHREK